MNKYCGTSVPMPILSQSNALWIEFYSDNSNEDQGFVLRLEAVYEGEVVELYLWIYVFTSLQSMNPEVNQNYFSVEFWCFSDCAS